MSLLVYPKRCKVTKRFLNQLTIRKGADNNVLSGDACTVLVVGHHTQTVLGVLLQPSQNVRLRVYVVILTQQRRERLFGSFY